MSALTGKPFQPYTSALNTTASGGSTAYQFIQVPRNLRRSHTAERSYRDINQQETSFLYERAPKNEALKEIVQSPYMNGKKNSNYINPTFRSSNFMNQSMELHRPRLAERKTEAPKLQRSHSQVNTRTPVANVDIQPVTQPTVVTPREAEITRKTEFTPRTNKNVTDASPKFNNAHVTITEPLQPATFGRRKSSVRGTESQREEAINERERVVEAAIDRYLEVCNDCYNADAAHENNDRRRKERQAEVELERAVMDYNNQLLRAEKEHQQVRKEAVQHASNSNFETFKERKARLASRERDVDEDVALKPHTKSLAAESLRSLQRYQSILDKMYENSSRKIDERKGDLRQSQQHNKNMIYRNEESRAEDRQNHTLVNFKVNNDKSMLDRIHDNSNNYMDTQAMERRRASEYNHRTGAQRNADRHASPMELHEDPFKQSGAEYERNGEGRGMMDRMYQSSMEYWKRQQQDLKDGSHANRVTSATLRNKKEQEDKEILYSYRYGARSNVKSMLNSMYEGDERGLDYRVNGTKDCANFNKTNGFSQEKIKTLENYYNSPTKKVNDTQQLDYSQWTHEHSGVFSKIHTAVDKLENDRRAQILENGSVVKQQMGESAYQRRDEIAKNRQFKETPLLVCSHKANLMYCNICNRKVPMNKISKILGDYKKFMKNKNSKCTL